MGKPRVWGSGALLRVMEASSKPRTASPYDPANKPCGVTFFATVDPCLMKYLMFRSAIVGALYNSCLKHGAVHHSGIYIKLLNHKHLWNSILTGIRIDPL